MRLRESVTVGVRSSRSEGIQAVTVFTLYMLKRELGSIQPFGNDGTLVPSSEKVNK